MKTSYLKAVLQPGLNAVVKKNRDAVTLGVLVSRTFRDLGHKVDEVDYYESEA
ncbi:MAG: hypothetical protein LPH21_19675 [Shewanella sp.]|nr:hypothetical protein [Shewanella sp.]MCF1431558.1 hypothetical protein [Shewanella sp.]MCF1459679.1 hypothetical protein [Shewanella sp.]